MMQHHCSLKFKDGSVQQPGGGMRMSSCETSETWENLQDPIADVFGGPECGQKVLQVSYRNFEKLPRYLFCLLVISLSKQPLKTAGCATS